MAAGCTLLDGTKKLKDYFALEFKKFLAGKKYNLLYFERIEMPVYLPLERRRRI